MTGEYQCLDGQEQRLDAQKQRVHQSDTIDHVQGDLPACARILRGNLLVIAGVRVDDTAAASSHPFETALVESLQVDKDRSGSCNILRFDQLLAAAKLASGDVILNRGD